MLLSSSIYLASPYTTLLVPFDTSASLKYMQFPEKIK